MIMDFSFYRNKKVFVTGHTGFKGSWLCRMLVNLGADVTGYALEPQTEPNLFSLSGMTDDINSIIGDVRDLNNLQKALADSNAEIVFHMAAQPIVREGYINPLYTYETNVMGTANLLECVKNSNCVKSFLNITTDKVYRNNENSVAFKESDFLDGYDPYSNSKSCSDIITQCYDRCFLKDKHVAVSTVRAGNVIGGGDFAKDRIIPDCIRAAEKGEVIKIRNPYAVRPFQHVIEPLVGYMLIAEKQYKDASYAGSYNIGPDEKDCITVGELADLFCRYWGNNIKWKNTSETNAPHEAGFLKLNCDKFKETFGWKPVWNIDKSIEMICRFSKIMLSCRNISDEMDYEIKKFLES